MPELLRVILFIIFVLSFAGLNAAYLVWCERKGAGHIQRRIGPKEVGPYGLLQPLADGAKLMSKQIAAEIPTSARSPSSQSIGAFTRPM